MPRDAEGTSALGRGESQTPKSKALLRRTPLTRSTPLNRGKSLDRGAGLARGGPMRHRSPTMDAYYRDVRVPLVVELIEREVEIHGAEEACAAPALFAIEGWEDPVGYCFGGLTVHERLRRSQLGSLENPANTLVLCALHNSAAACCARGDAWHRAGIVVFEGDDGWQSLLARRGERKQRPA